jgi:PadR family transcriptional regulator, regulatory protein PadR
MTSGRLLRRSLDLRPIPHYAERQKVEAFISSPRFPIPQGTLDMLILQILSLEPAHGYGIAQRLEQISRSVVQVNQGSLYPALHRLEQKGWLKAEWKQSETGREAKFYSLTNSGRKQLAVEKVSWARLTGAVELIFNEGNMS